MGVPSPKAILAGLLAKAGYEVRRRNPGARGRLLGLADRPIRSVIDVGANTGQFAQEAARLFPEAAIYSFEPQPEAFRRLSVWASARPNTRVFNVALGAADGVLEMKVHVDHHYSSSLLRSTPLLDETYPATKKQVTAQVTVRTLDGFAAEAGIGLVPEVLVKLDVQGYEDRVIAGGPKTFRQASACVLEVNLDPLYEKQAAFREIFSRLDALGFRYAGNLDQVCGPDGHVIFLDAVFLR